MAFYIGTKNAAGLMPEPAHKGITVTDETIWASNTGRAQNGTMVGDIVAAKKTVEVTWPPLSFSDSQKLRNAIVNAGPFFTIYYPDFSSDVASYESLTVYASNLPRTLYSIANGLRYHMGVSVTFIEQ